jgi:hypothetical protein
MTTPPISSDLDLATRVHEMGRRDTAIGNPVASKFKGGGPSAEKADLGEGWRHVVQGSVFSMPSLNPTSYTHFPPGQRNTQAAKGDRRQETAKS